MTIRYTPNMSESAATESTGQQPAKSRTSCWQRFPLCANPFHRR